MKKLIFLLTTLIFFGFTQDNFVKVEVAENITIFIPKGFTTVSQEEINRRIHSPRVPLAYYSDSHNEVDFSVNMSYSLWAQKDIEILRSFYRSTLLSLYDEINFLKDEVVTVNGREYAEFEFESVVKDDEDAIIAKGVVKKYTLIRYTILENNNTVLINFTCPLPRKEHWQVTAHQIMDKVNIK